MKRALGVKTSAIGSACEKALVAAAMTEGAGTRQVRRAAARRFVRRHRRNGSYLRWVLRSVAASSALAVTLLGLGTQSATAAMGTTSMLEKTGAANPLNGVDLGSTTKPTTGDLDGDGDLDVVCGKSGGDLHYLENTGSAISPAFVERTGAANPFENLYAVFTESPELGDVDGDGDLDLVAGRHAGDFYYYENTGTASLPAFVRRIGAPDNPFFGLSTNGRATPALGDVDHDGDLDLVSGELSGTFRFYENTGNASSPAFVQRTGSSNPLDGADIGDYSNPSLDDFDGDGDLDLVVGQIWAPGPFHYFENTSFTTDPVFVQRTGARNPLDGQSTFNGDSTPELVDLDGDGDMDVLSGQFQGTFHYFENLAGHFILQAGVAEPFATSANGVPALGDLDGDGDLDAVTGEVSGAFLYFENGGGPGNPSFVLQTGVANPLDGEATAAAVSSPALADLDGDGDLDLVAGDSTGVFSYFENTGSAASPAFVERTFTENPLIGRDVGANAVLSLGDVDGDGDLDVVSGASSGTFFYFENTGSALSPAFSELTGSANPFDGFIVPNVYSRAALADVDNDGDLDLVAGSRFYNMRYYENVGTATGPVYIDRGASDDNPVYFGYVHNAAPTLGDLDADGDVDLLYASHGGTFGYAENTTVEGLPRMRELTGSDNPLDGENVGGTSTPALGDLDGDGDLDLLSNERYGSFPNYVYAIRYYQNSGSAINPAWALQTGSANPLNGENSWVLPTQALGDLDGDGDLDLLLGERYGSFPYYENTGDATSPEFMLKVGTANPLDGENVGSRSAPALADLDGDGDLDVVAGDVYGTFSYFENTGSAASPAFVLRGGGANPLNGQATPGNSRPTIADVDGDGDLDLFVGEDYGTTFFYENTGSRTAPAFVSRTGAANPMDGVDVGSGSKPALGDIDGNGRPDVVLGRNSGTFRTFYVPEPAQGLMLGAGIALLRLLDRLRGRRER